MIVNCSWCGSDEYVAWDAAAGVAVCTGPGHPVARMWEPKQESATRLKALADGIAAELGLYDDLLACLGEDEWAETGVVEHRYGTAHPTTYRWMVNRWGHVAQGPRQYSVTSFIGSTLGALCRAQLARHRSGKGTGFFDYNQTLGYWALPGTGDDALMCSWEDTATAMGHHPRDWPLLNHRYLPSRG